MTDLIRYDYYVYWKIFPNKKSIDKNYFYSFEVNSILKIFVIYYSKYYDSNWVIIIIERNSNSSPKLNWPLSNDEDLHAILGAFNLSNLIVSVYSFQVIDIFLLYLSN